MDEKPVETTQPAKQVALRPARLLMAVSLLILVLIVIGALIAIWLVKREGVV